MSQRDKNILDYIVVCISEFARRNLMETNDAYKYLKSNKGIEFLKEFYDVEHTLSFDDVMNDLKIVCAENGGTI